MSGNTVVTSCTGMPLAWHCFCCSRFGLPVEADDGTGSIPVHCACCRHMDEPTRANAIDMPGHPHVVALATIDRAAVSASPYLLTADPAPVHVAPYLEYHPDCPACEAEQESNSDSDSDSDSEANILDKIDELFEHIHLKGPNSEAGRERLAVLLSSLQEHLNKLNASANPPPQQVPEAETARSKCSHAEAAPSDARGSPSAASSVAGSSGSGGGGDGYYRVLIEEQMEGKRS
ncbi:uncharacterized protein CLAFUR5_04735 [Fulvia fulva]|uniref:Uncharacterized protein n=1 Tax=Passalora fulva TaxID=5499 RepID=A0A9Q8P895_PASFU|nr:uncharacterized protein CLAFUR5_04735 [Fulvia fulva]UJO16980.1 hypothetical protein CLAFUR5_04735 [Fulvia fulva]